MTGSRPSSRVGRHDADELFRQHHSRLVRTLQWHFSRVPRDLVDDACSFAWMQMLRRELDREGVFAWLYTVAKHELFALLARRRREELAEDPGVAVEVECIEEYLEVNHLRELISRLKPQQRLVLRLRMDGYSYNQICELTGQTYTWVNRHITEGRQALRDLLADE